MTTTDGSLSANVTIEEFLAGETLTYRAGDGKPMDLTYRVGVGMFLERNGRDVGKIDAITDLQARRAYYNLTGGIGGQAKEEARRVRRSRDPGVPAKKARRKAD